MKERDEEETSLEPVRRGTHRCADTAQTFYLHIVLAHEDAIFLVFSHPDYTVGPGTSPGPASL